MIKTMAAIIMMIISKSRSLKFPAAISFCTARDCAASRAASSSLSWLTALFTCWKSTPADFSAFALVPWRANRELQLHSNRVRRRPFGRLSADPVWKLRVLSLAQKMGPVAPAIRPASSNKPTYKRVQNFIVSSNFVWALNSTGNKGNANKYRESSRGRKNKYQS